jgi:hypothetical protein
MYLHLKLLRMIYQPHLPVKQDLLSCRTPQCHAGSSRQEPAGMTEKSYHITGPKADTSAKHSLLHEI